MQHRTDRNSTIITYSLLGGAALGSFLLPGRLTLPTAYAYPGPSAIRIQGIVRDFKSSHPDMNVVPAGGFGHYAGNVPLLLDPDADRPTLDAGTGFKVATQWRDSASRPIPPHLYMSGSDDVMGAMIDGAIFLSEDSLIDSWDSTQGTYAETVGADAVIATNAALEDDVFLQVSSQIQGDLYVGVGAPSEVLSLDATSDVTGSMYHLTEPLEMPVVTAPTDMGPSVGDFNRSGAGTTVLASDLHCDEFFIELGHVVQVSGDVRILVEDAHKTLGFELADGARVELMPGATLTVYCHAQVKIHHSSSVNLDGDPNDVTFYQLGNAAFNVQHTASVFATVIAPNCDVRVQQTSNFYGTVTAKRLNVTQFGAIHLDQQGAAEVCGAVVTDTAGAPGVASTGGVTSAATFDEWFSDLLGTNLSTYRTITLTDNGAGVYEYIDDTFHPIDDVLLGNEGAAHNYYFTFEFKASFTFSACSGQFFEFTGTDDAWMYVDGRLALDLGGMSQGVGQHVPLDRLELVDGETYEMNFFYAQRQGTDAIFRMRTNVPLVGQFNGMITQTFD